MDVKQMKDILTKQIDAFVAGDWKAFRATLTDDASYEEEATHRHVEGQDAIIQLNKGWRDAFPDVKAKLKDVVASGDSLVVEIEWSGTHTGTLTTPFGTIAPTNRVGRVSAVQVARFDGNKIRELRHYFDLLTILAQLGVVPQKGAPSPAP